jgi:hypothetical protein
MDPIDWFFYRKEIKTNIYRSEALIKSSVITIDPGRICERDIVMTYVLSEETSPR